MIRQLVVYTVGCALLFGVGWSSRLHAEQVLLDRMVHLRSGDEREWDEFPAEVEAKELALTFSSAANAQGWTLELVQEDVKQAWEVWVNQERLGRLPLDENPMRVYFSIPNGCLVDGENQLKVACAAGQGRASDDIRFGRVVLRDRPREACLSEARLSVEVRDSATGRKMPGRLTIVDGRGVLQQTAATSNDRLAVRPGVIYTADGIAEWSLPAGAYTVYAGRGFEYSLASRQVSLGVGEAVTLKLSIERQVSTDGWVACDTHVHTLTYSGHGDASIKERMITLVGEGIELPVATDHDVHVDYEPVIQELDLGEWLTPVMGNEVTTGVGHFNVFPVARGARIPNSKLADWKAIFAEVYATPGVKIVILNHARDIHRGYRPFDPARYDALAAENLSGWPVAFNAMEVINSSAIQTNVRTLFEDWLGLLNRGYCVTPVGSSDSHDVARFAVGQGRTYIRCDDSDPRSIDVATAVNHFRQGQVAVSYGLLVQAQVESKYGPGEVATVSDGTLSLDCTVQAPHWIEASDVELYMNGVPVRAERISRSDRSSLPTGTLWRGRWELERPAHDVCLAVMALGPGIPHSFWPTAKPYQPIATAWDPQVFGCTGAMWVDVDGDGYWTSAHEYAQQVLLKAAGDGGRLLNFLASYDEAVSMHVAHALRRQEFGSLAAEVRGRLSDAAPHVLRGFEREAASWRATQRARVEAAVTD